jgi:diguanylate cyclase (GGDEF)-like protein
MSNDTREWQLGLAHLVKSLKSAGLQILNQARPWPERRVTYFVIGKADRQTDIVLSDHFISDLPNTIAYHPSLDAYVAAVAGRIKYGSPETFYCRSGRTVRIEINWPSETANYGGFLKTWLRIGITETEHSEVAKCGVQVEPRSIGTDATAFDEVRRTINRVRRATDDGLVTFYEPKTHPNQYQQISLDSGGSAETVTPNTEIELQSFLTGKAYFMGFRSDGVPKKVWAADPWDAEYLGVAPKELVQTAFILRARDLVQIEEPTDAISAANKLLVEGWPAALGITVEGREPQKITPRALPNKEKLDLDVRASLKRRAGSALLVIDLDNFKQVNDTKGHNEGDECLQRVVNAISESLGRKGTLYRWGGDEFAVVLPDFSIEEGKATAERIRRAIEDSRPGQDIAVTASIGVAASGNLDAPSAESFLDAADKATYESKKLGKNRVTSWPF